MSGEAVSTEAMNALLTTAWKGLQYYAGFGLSRLRRFQLERGLERMRMAQTHVSERQKEIRRKARELASAENRQWRDLSKDERKKFKQQARSAFPRLQQPAFKRNAAPDALRVRPRNDDSGKITALVLEKYPIAYVFTPKVGSTSIKHALYQLENGRPWERGIRPNGRPNETAEGQAHRSSSSSFTEFGRRRSIGISKRHSSPSR